MEYLKLNPKDSRLVYCGRIDMEQEEGPLFVFPASFVRFKMSGKVGLAKIKNQRDYFQNTIGVLVNGVYMGKLLLADEGETLIDFSGFLTGELSEVTLYKTQDGCHQFHLQELWVAQDAVVEAGTPLPKRRIEVYGDSISAGELSELMDLVASPDPENHQGLPSNSYYSYSWFLARKLNACLHDIAQGGIALKNGQGWYDGPNYLGMESVYDKISYQPRFGKVKNWDFGAYIPQLVIVAIGQNDANPVNYMAQDYEGSQGQKWREEYKAWIQQLMRLYPKAYIVLTTTILNHDEGWDRAIEQVCRELESPRVKHFLYEKNGCGTPGHVRAPEAERMAAQLAAYVAELKIDWEE